MAHVRFDLTKALNRESYAYNCWVNKNYEKNTLENTERFGEALTTSESINVQVTPENPESGNNPFGFNISEGEEDANPFNKKPVI